jgi:hypothetical protein
VLRKIQVFVGLVLASIFVVPALMILAKSVAPFQFVVIVAILSALAYAARQNQERPPTRHVRRASERTPMLPYRPPGK